MVWIFVVLALAAVAVIVLLLVNASRGRRSVEDIPPAMRPGYSDEELERKVLERYMGWGIVLVAFFAIFLPLYWMREPARLTTATNAATVQNFERGEELFVENCALCHGQTAEGGGTGSTYDPADNWPAPNLTTIEKRYEETPVAQDIRDYIVSTIQRGRPGTPMPAWGSAYGGPMTDQQIEDIADWILLNQKATIEDADAAFNMSGEELFQSNCARCHGENLEGFIGPSLEGVFERHNRQTILGILKNGIFLANGISMPPWQNGYMYDGARYKDVALNKIVRYLEQQQPDEIPDEAKQYRAPYGDGGPKGEADTEEPPAGGEDEGSA
ncbi:MAG: c-type cytochrome [Nitriliruptorales bacterium]|nr:c-type cytochrome [Nitriliruptorales bacterium]